MSRATRRGFIATAALVAAAAPLGSAFAQGEQIEALFVPQLRGPGAPG